MSGGRVPMSLAAHQFCEQTLRKGVIALRQEFNNLCKYTAPDFSRDAHNANLELNRYKGESKTLSSYKDTTLSLSLALTSPNAATKSSLVSDVACGDVNRVVLTDGSGVDYIHANFVLDDDGKKRYICTQGPKQETVVDFWRMVLQENCTTIVMLCQIMELNKVSATAQTRLTNVCTSINLAKVRGLLPDEEGRENAD